MGRKVKYVFLSLSLSLFGIFGISWDIFNVGVGVGVGVYVLADCTGRIMYKKMETVFLSGNTSRDLTYLSIYLPPSVNKEKKKNISKLPIFC